MTSHPLMNRLAVAVLLISAAVFGAAVQRDITLQQCRHIPQRSQNPTQPIAQHAASPTHTNHAEPHR